MKRCSWIESTRFGMVSGLAPLVASPTLTAAARHHAESMATYNYFPADYSVRHEGENHDQTITWQENIANFGYPDNTHTTRSAIIGAGTDSAVGDLPLADRSSGLSRCTERPSLSRDWHRLRQQPGFGRGESTGRSRSDRSVTAPWRHATAWRSRRRSSGVVGRTTHPILLSHTTVITRRIGRQHRRRRRRVPGSGSISVRRSRSARSTGCSRRVERPIPLRSMYRSIGKRGRRSR